MNRMIFPAIAVALAVMMPAAVVAQSNSNQQMDQRDQNKRGDRQSDRSTKGNDARSSAGQSTGGQGVNRSDSATRTPRSLGGSSQGQGSAFGGGTAVTQDRKSSGPGTTGDMRNRGVPGGGQGSVIGTDRRGTSNRGPSTMQGRGPSTMQGQGPSIMRGRERGGQAQTVRPQNWNRYPRTFDRNVYQRNYSASRHFHWRTYSRPHGWYSHRWIFGELFPSFFWTDEYRIYDYWMFGLPIPPYGYVWVRYGDDAILVNVRTGRILQVVYDLFD